ncbi:hypothetical protein NDU88_011503 [Pleurodeles waltl]|uniref:Secreted protein n=1 Tax=Pleurodeles waltl TaxID=8319 RepID=A0AAV7QXF8_PLEWA|nr:hypothetical protein NDU88_011503 [Pleurodeles waltl]
MGWTGPTRTVHLLVLPLPLLTRVNLLIHPIAVSHGHPSGNSGVQRACNRFLGGWRSGVVRRRGRRPTGRKKKTGRQESPGHVQQIPGLCRADRTINRLQAEGEQQETGCPIRGQRRQTPGSKT